MKTMSTGKAFEKSLIQTMDAYRTAGLATFEKVEPPTLTLHRGAGRSPRIVHLKNPFLDFTGAWTELGGKALHLEAKYTTDPILSIRAEGGIKEIQLENALRWEAAGAAVAFLWRCKSETRIITPRMVLAQLSHRKSLRLVDAHRIPQGPGFILIDFLAILRQLHKPKPKP